MSDDSKDESAFTPRSSWDDLVFTQMRDDDHFEYKSPTARLPSFSFRFPTVSEHAITAASQPYLNHDVPYSIHDAIELETFLGTEGETPYPILGDLHASNFADIERRILGDLIAPTTSSDVSPTLNIEDLIETIKSIPGRDQFGYAQIIACKDARAIEEMLGFEGIRSETVTGIIPDYCGMRVIEDPSLAEGVFEIRSQAHQNLIDYCRQDVLLTADLLSSIYGSAPTYPMTFIGQLRRLRDWIHGLWLTVKWGVEDFFDYVLGRDR